MFNFICSLDTCVGYACIPGWLTRFTTMIAFRELTDKAHELEKSRAGITRDADNQVRSLQQDNQSLLSLKTELENTINELRERIELLGYEKERINALHQEKCAKLEDTAKILKDKESEMNSQREKLQLAIEKCQDLRERDMSNVEKITKLKQHLDVAVEQSELKGRQIDALVVDNENMQLRMQDSRKRAENLETAIKQMQKEHDIQLRDLQNSPVMQRARRLCMHTEQAIEKLLKTEEATESTLTCMICMSIFEEPRMSITCGHIFCNKYVADGIVVKS